MAVVEKNLVTHILEFNTVCMQIYTAEYLVQPWCKNFFFPWCLLILYVPVCWIIWYNMPDTIIIVKSRVKGHTRLVAWEAMVAGKAAGKWGCVHLRWLIYMEGHKRSCVILVAVGFRLQCNLVINTLKSHAQVTLRGHGFGLRWHHCSHVKAGYVTQSIYPRYLNRKNIRVVFFIFVSWLRIFNLYITRTEVSSLKSAASSQQYSAQF